MKFTISLTTLALAVVVFASPVRRGTSTLQTEILQISNAADELNNAITLFSTSPSLVTVLPVTVDLTALTGAVTVATTGAATSGTITASNSGAIVSSITALASHIDSALTNLVSARPDFNSLLVEPSITTTEANLALLQTAMTAFEDALSSELPAVTLAIDFDSINNPVTAAINAFGLNLGL
ncbi:hypothetical protein PENSPDRAFT_730938 [Peniophora sp. CONT]|nr:hypothetical protein PENSPDRAFT_730938 [Peniophora sp. CONT]